ncbi:uroporphyrinogen-III synthase [Paraglaciecola aquimarina]|uniref:Uroporphyrinogen-III synthase n=1 Tax=Paraglaciecola aquimarina TaxID=1235557 RepID=A0ABU3SU14_9ALTE|nr:uroporphyrinogen-III synthase [Paraglaciecola aquimarina]MDU0353500.1 uroporphyrinogen-III synthase [Paraglaciecola aquimarina]
MYLLLRPQTKCQSSAVAFKQAGLNAVACGLIDTVLDQAAVAQLPDKIRTLSTSSFSQHLILVTSTVAAEQCALLKQLWPTNCVFFAVGASTGQILAESGIAAIVPKEARTEGLLALPELNNIDSSSVVIMKGYGGRELLRHTLSSRAALVQEWEVYKRQRLTKPLSTQDWQASQISCIIATSGEVIQAAFAHFESTWLTQLKWIVVSERIARIASTLGIKQIEISRDASDQALIQCAQNMMLR